MRQQCFILGLSIIYQKAYNVFDNDKSKPITCLNVILISMPFVLVLSHWLWEVLGIFLMLGVVGWFVEELDLEKIRTESCGYEAAFNIIWVLYIMYMIARSLNCLSFQDGGYGFRKGVFDIILFFVFIAFLLQETIYPFINTENNHKTTSAKLVLTSLAIILLFSFAKTKINFAEDLVFGSRPKQLQESYKTDLNKQVRRPVGIVRVDVANIRSGPSTKNSIIGKAQKGEKLEIISESSKNWCRIKHNGREGYIYKKLVIINYPKYGTNYHERP
jgi:hypothetical protein